MKSPKIISATTDTRGNPTFIDWWFFIHFLAGFFAAFVLSLLFPKTKRFTLYIVWLIIHTIYEMKDYYFCYIAPPKPKNEDLNERYNIAINSLGDTLGTSLGFWFYFLVIAQIDCKK